MAPIRPIKIYKRTRISNKSETVLNNLLASNISQRLKSTERIRNSLEHESTFDKLLKSTNFQRVLVSNYPENNVFSLSLDNESVSLKVNINDSHTKDIGEIEGILPKSVNYESECDDVDKINFLNEIQLTPIEDKGSASKNELLKSTRKYRRKSIPSSSRASKALFGNNESGSSINSDDVIESSIINFPQKHKFPNVHFLKGIRNASTPLKLPTDIDSSFLNESHRIIKEWNIARPDSNSFITKKISKNSFGITKRKKKNIASENLNKKLVVMIKRSSLLEKILNDPDIIKTSRNLESNLPQLMGINEKKLRENNKFFSKIPKVHLTRLNLSPIRKFNVNSLRTKKRLFENVTRRKKNKDSCENIPIIIIDSDDQESVEPNGSKMRKKDSKMLKKDVSNDKLVVQTEKIVDVSKNSQIKTPNTRVLRNRKNSNLKNTSKKIESTHECSKNCECFLKKCVVRLEKFSHDLVNYRSENERSDDTINSRINNPEWSMNGGESSTSSLNISKVRYKNFIPGKKFRRSIALYKKAKEGFNKSGFSVNDFRRSRKINIIDPSITEISEWSELRSFISNGAGSVSQPEEFVEEIQEKLGKTYISVNESFNVDISHTARDIVLRKCDQIAPLRFEQCYTPSILRHCQKIGEGTFGEVFMYRDKDGSTTVMKIIPIEGELIVNLEKQKTFEEILHEITISLELSNLRKTKRNNTDGFVELKNVKCVQGKYPDRLLELWDLYQENKNCENDCPEVFQDDQLFIILELSNGGTDLEAFQFINAKQALAAFKQIACTLAVAESALHFEHRDLHWGNVLISHTNKSDSVYVLDGKEITIPNEKIKVTIIDYTLSRIDQNGLVIFSDLSKEEDLFNAKGDYQFEIYRQMRIKNRNNWQNYEPITNLLWLHYVLDKASKLRYKNTKTKIHKSCLNLLKKYENEILSYNSTIEFVLKNF